MPVSRLLAFALVGLGASVCCTPVPTGQNNVNGVPDPGLLPLAIGQAPDFAFYDGLNMPGRAAGYSYNDPTTGVRIWKATSAAVPLANNGAGHDYSEGGPEISLGWGPNSNTHTIMMLVFKSSGGSEHWLVDFTRGVGFANYRRLTVQPDRDGCASFSNLASQPQILYIHTGTQLVRYNTATMAVENTGHFPKAVSIYAWLQHDRNDEWFVGLLGDNKTVWAWNSQTDKFMTHYETWTNEPYLEQDGRYVVLTSGGPYTTQRYWDVTDSTFGPVQDGTFHFHLSHAGRSRSRWSSGEDNDQARWGVNGGEITKTVSVSVTPGDSHSAGQWIQSDAELPGGDLNKQWMYTGAASYTEFPQYSQLLWKLAIGTFRIDGSENRMLLHHYSMPPHSDYYSDVWPQPSPDGRIVIFNSNMHNAGGRWDLFVAEVPLRSP